MGLCWDGSLLGFFGPVVLFFFFFWEMKFSKKDRERDDKPNPWEFDVFRMFERK
jgi:hypothetical protein